MFWSSAGKLTDGLHVGMRDVREIPRPAGQGALLKGKTISAFEHVEFQASCGIKSAAGYIGLDWK